MIEVLQRRGNDYSRFNLDYANLNSKLNVVKSRVIKSTGMRRASSALSLIDTRTFAEVLDQEVEKVVLFYIQEQGNIAKKAWLLRERQLLHLQQSDVDMNIIDDLFDRYRELGAEILDLLDYLDDNVIKLRKIISKHDTLFDQKMSSYYFDTKLGKSSRNQQLLPLYHQEGIQAIMSTLQRGFEDLYEAKDALCNPLDALPAYLSPSKGLSSKTLPRVSFGARQLSYGNLQDAISDKFSGATGNLSGKFSSDARHRSTGNLQQLLSRTRTASRDSSMSKAALRPKPSLSVSDMEPILRKIAEAASRVMESQQQSISEYLAATSLLALEVSVDDLMLHRADSSDQLDEKIKTVVEAPLYGLYINLFITFLYLANQYVVAPTSGEYARLLGMSPAMSGLIIGLTPAAALLSSLIYSMWSNYSFKDPIICCIMCAFIGNLFYGMALQCNASWMLLLGRLLTGFGGPRVISRRYIVDHVPQASRQVASSEFVTAGALGLAFGPLLSSLVTRSAVRFEWEGIIDFQAVTAPGWIMAALWVVALLATVLVFEEPDQKRMRCNKIAQPKSTANLLDRYELTSNHPFHQRQQDYGYYQQHGSTNPYASNSHAGEFDRPKGSLTAAASNNQGGFDFSMNSALADNSNSRGILKSALKKPSLSSSSSSQPVQDTINASRLELYQISEGQDERPSNNSSMGSLATLAGGIGGDSKSSSGGGFSTMMSPQNNGSRSSRNSSTASLLAGGTASVTPPSSSATLQTYKHTAVNERTRLLDSRPTEASSHASYADSSYHGYADSDIAVIIEAEDGNSFYQYFTYEMMAVLMVYVVNKIGQELTVSSIPFITCNLLGWSQELSGYYMCFMGALVLPMNILVNRYVHDVDERDMVLRLTCLCVCSSLFMCHSEWLGDSYAIGQYVLGSVCLFACLNSLEGIIMAVLAKIVSPDLARGTFNSALLATEAGTLGRVVGDLFLTAYGVVGEDKLVVLNVLFLPFCLSLMLSLAVIYVFYEKLL